MDGSSTQRSSKGRPHFVQVHCGPRVQTLFVVIPGVGTLHPDHWSDGTGDFWPRSARPAHAYDVGIFSFENQLTTGNTSFSYRQVESQGAEFLAALYDLIQEDELGGCPIILSSHSLGGLVLKRALCLAHSQPRFRNLLEGIACILLFSCPHSHSDGILAWQTIPSILKTYSKSKLKHTISREDVAALAEDCVGFENVADSIPVLSLHEGLQTRTGGRFSKKIMMVGKQNVITHTKLERALEVSADHNNICCLRSDSHELNTVLSFIDEGVAEVRKAIKQRLQKYVRPAAFTATTLRSCESTDELQAQVSEPETSSSKLVTSLAVTSLGGTVGSTAASFQMIPTLTDFSTEQSDPRLPCFVVPLSRNRHFFGRIDVIEALDKALVRGDIAFRGEGAANLRTYALCGPGGMGKTQIATEFIYRRKGDFDAVFWVNADETSKLSQSFNDIALSLGLVVPDSVDSRDHILTRDLVLGWLANPLKSYKRLEKAGEEASWLLIFDNADNPDILNGFWPIDSPGSVLITSRDPLAKTHFYSQGGGMMLPPFRSEEALTLLLGMTGRTNDLDEHSSGDAVAKTLGGIPLAISQMAGVIARRDLSFSEFLRQYQEESARYDLFRLQIKDLNDTGYSHTIASVWALDGLKKGSVLLEVLALLDADGIPEYILDESKTRHNLVDYPQSSLDYQEARAELLQSSLIMRERKTKRIVVHRLIQDAARSKMSDERFHKIFVFALCLVSAAWPYEEFGFGNELYRFERCSELYPHVLWLQKLSTRFRPPTELVAAHLEGPRLLLDAAWYKIMRGDNYLETTPLLDMARSMCESLQKGEKLLTPGYRILNEELETLLRLFHHHHGVIGLHTNRPKQSLTHFIQFTDMLQKKLGGNKTQGGNDQSLGVAWNELGNAYLQNDAYAEAEDCFLKSIHALRSLTNSTKISINMPLINLAFCHWLQGDLDKSESVFQESLEDREREYGVNDTTSLITGKLLLGFGNVRVAQGRFGEGFKLHQRCLMQYKSTIGNNHHRTGDACIALSAHYVRLSEYDTALALLDQALKIYGDLAHFMPERARVNYKRGKLLNMLSRAEEGALNFNTAGALYRKISPGDVRSIDLLRDEDFDNKIVFWSR